MELIRSIAAIVMSTTMDVLPIVVFLFGFQALVIRQPLPRPGRLAAGLALVVVGLGLFLIGLEQSLFPLGRQMAVRLTAPDVLVHSADASAPVWHAYFWVYAFAVSIGFATTIAEPALLAIAIKANEVSAGAIGVWGLRVAVALGVAAGVGLGCYRIVSGLPLHLFIMAGYVVVLLQTLAAPKIIVPLAYDSGGVTTSTVTVPLVTALGLGLAETLPGRNPLLDGFGLVAFASLFPIISVLAYAQLSALRSGSRSSEES